MDLVEQQHEYWLLTSVRQFFYKQFFVLTSAKEVETLVSPELEVI